MSSRDHFPTIPPKEMDFLMEMFAQDSKNYHVWTYRHWLVRHFELWDSPREIADINSLINSDVRNNSAWNHRYMLRFGPRSDQPDGGLVNANGPPSEKGRLVVVDEDLVDEELQYAQVKIASAPENRSPWSYARGVLRAAGRPLSEWTDFARKFVVDNRDDEGKLIDVQVKSSHAVEWLADTYAQSGPDEAVRMLNLLKEKYDPIRKNYWDYRINQIINPNVQATA
jgi:protein farnesyltransferase/geranylgeranyltransferase type-1 subunit alpha